MSDMFDSMTSQICDMSLIKGFIAVLCNVYSIYAHSGIVNGTMFVSYVNLSRSLSSYMFDQIHLESV